MTSPNTKAERAVLQAMHDYDLRPGQMLLMGPLSCAYLRGDFRKAPWLVERGTAPGGKLLPDKFVLEKQEWQTSSRNG